MSLLTKAKTAKVDRNTTATPVNKEEVELAIAWINQEVVDKQVQFALERDIAVGNWAATTLRKGVRQGLLDGIIK
jgi:hypothetical protein